MVLPEAEGAPVKSFFGIGLLWAGYVCAWYAWTNWSHAPVGITDLVMPSHLPALASKLGQAKSASTTASIPQGRTAQVPTQVLV